MVIYRTSAGDECEAGNSGIPGWDETLSQGQSSTGEAWIVLVDAINPSYPNGNPAALGMTYAAVTPDAHATGPDVCTGNTDTDGLGAGGPPYVHFAGTVFPFEQCTGSYS